MNSNCDCCQGLDALTPLATANRPGLTALHYRVGTHATFLKTMLARLSSQDLPALAALRTRDPRDPAIALLDAWATVADVLTFYQERIANEGYLRTATERRSILELAQLVGYQLRPGVASSVYLAFTMEPDFNENAEVPQGTRSQSLPAPGEMPQAFETEQNLEARTDWNQLQPRLSQPQFIVRSNAGQKPVLYFQGLTTNLKPNAPLLLVFGDGDAEQVLRRVKSVTPQPNQKQTQVELLTTATQVVETSAAPSSESRDLAQPSQPSLSLALPNLDTVQALSKPPSFPPANAQQLQRTSTQAFAPEIDIAPQLLVNLKPALKPNLYQAWRNTKVPVDSSQDRLQSIEKFGIQASPFGHNAPLRPIYEDNQGHPIGYEEWPLTRLMAVGVSLRAIEARVQAGLSLTLEGTTQLNTLSLNQREMTTTVGEQTVHITSAESSRNRAKVRFIHVLPEDGNVDVYINQTLVFGNVSPFQTTHYINLSAEAADDFELAVRTAGQAATSEPLIRQIMTAVDVGDIYSIYALEIENMGDLQGRVKLLVSRQDLLIARQDSPIRIRVFNASSMRTGLQIKLDEIDLLPVRDESDAISDNYVDLPNEGTYRLSVSQLEDGTVLLPTQEIIIKAGYVYDVVVTDGTVADGIGEPPTLALNIFETETIFPQERFRFAFKFLNLAREYRFILANGDDSTGTRIFVQVLNGSSITSEFSQNGTQTLTIDNKKVTVEGSLTNPENPLTIRESFSAQTSPSFYRVIALDAQYDQILPGSWVVIQHPNRRIMSRVQSVSTISKAEYGITGKVTQLTLEKDWLDANDQSLSVLRETTLYAQSAPLDLADEILDDPIQHVIDGEATDPDGPFEIELAGLYNGLKPGRWLIVSGERADIPGATGVKASELVMLAGVRQGVAQVKLPQSGGTRVDLPGDTPHSFLQLAQPLAYQYKRDTVTLYGNVVKATHGETRREALGSGDGSKTLQQFELSKSPLTHLSAPTRRGTESTLEVRINDVEWHQVDSLAHSGATDHCFATRTDNDDKTTVIFGDGEHGARLPSGVENVTAVYRDGIGQVGNVKAEQIKLLATRPLGVKGVINPQPATGGANRETLLQAQRNAPMAVMALDRLVSVQDYADFVRTFAGIAKADAQQLSNGRRQLIHLTIAGVDNSPIEKHSDLYRNLGRALKRFGDPYQPVQVDLRELMLLIISARVRILPDYLWESVKGVIEATLFEQFSFERRHLGQDVLLSEVISTLQQVPGVAYVDVDILDGISETEAENPEILALKLMSLAQSGDRPDQPRSRIPVSLATVTGTAAKPIQQAQLAILSADLPETLKLEEIT